MLNAYARIQSILCKADFKPSSEVTYSLDDAESWEIIKLLQDFARVVKRAADNYDPSLIAKYAISLAQAIIEYIHNRTGAKTLFATHYHELTELSTSLTQLENVHVATLEKDGQVTFLHKIEVGPADKSYGIHVAKIAGLPNDLLTRADQILTRLESQVNEKPSFGIFNTLPADAREKNQVAEQMSLFTETTESPILDELRQLDIYNMTPMEVMLAVAEIKKKL